MRPHSGFRRDIQGLRGVAVLMVVFYHADIGNFSGGYIGVDVFFVISGYLITGLLFGELNATAKIDLHRFYARRMRRLLPAGAIVLAATFAGFWWLYSPVERQRLASIAMATALYSSNIWFALYATDYLGGDGATNPLLHTWSLAVEEQFYLFWPVLMATIGALVRTSRRRGFVIVGIVILTTLSFVAAVWLIDVSRPWAFFGSPTRAWEFGIGALTCLARDESGRLSRPERVAVSAIGLSLVLGAAAIFNADTKIPGAPAMMPALGTALTIFAGTEGDPGAYRLLRMGPLVWIGDLSYGWYLWHWPIIVAIKESHYAQSAVLMAAGIALSLLLAWGMHRLVENPIRQLPWLLPRPKTSIAAGVTITLLLAGVSFAGREQAKFSSLTPEQAFIKLAQEDTPKLLSQAGCHANVSQVSIPKNCTFGNLGAQNAIVLFGDSHAEQWFPALERLALENHWRLISITKSGCPAASVVPYLDNLRRPYRECERWRQLAFERIAELRPSLVVVGNSYGYGRFADGRSQDGPEWSNGIDRTLGVLERVAHNVLLLRDTPRPSYDVPICLSRAAAKGRMYRGACQFNPEISSNDAIFAIEQKVVAAHRRVRTADLSRDICPDSPCSVVRNGMVLFSDSNHMTSRFSASQAPNLLEKILPLMQSDANVGH